MSDAVNGKGGGPATPQWPADRPERRALATLRPFPRNARTHSAEQIAQVARSIEHFGWTMPVLIEPSGEIIAGHARVLAAQSLGIDSVPCIVAAGWSDEQKRAYVIADNKLGLNAGWDDALLTLELRDLKSIGFDLGLTGFEAGEIDELFARADLKAGLTDPDAVPEVPTVAFTEPGDVWLLGRHRLLCGDCTIADNVAKALDGARPHLMVTDPPYGVDYDPKWRDGVDLNLGKRLGQNGSGRSIGIFENDDRADWREAWALFEGDVAYVWHGGLHSNVVADSLVATGFEMRAQIIWAKQLQVFSRGDYHWQHEPCWYAVRKGGKGHWAGDRKQTTVWNIPNNNPLGGGGEKKLGHSAQKPVETMLRPMLNNSRAGESVYEPFCGSGTSLIAAQMSGRRCLAIELNPAYVDVAVRRWQDFTGERAMRESDGALLPTEEKGPSDEARTEGRAAGAA
jgi:DNA modification methylase